MSELLEKAIVDKLRTVTDLVTEVGHSVGEHRIAKVKPNVKGRLPFVGVHIEDSRPLIGSDATNMEAAEVWLHCAASAELQATKIARMIKELLQDSNDPAKDANLWYYDFSNADICNRMTRWAGTGPKVFDAENDAWWCVVVARLIWVKGPCSPA